MGMNIPAHVPPELVVDINIYNMPVSNDFDPQQAWRAFTGKGPLVFSPHNGGHWIAAEGQEILDFYKDPEHFSSSQIIVPDHPGVAMPPIMSDPPDHFEYRKNVMTFFTQGVVEDLSHGMRDLLISLIEAVRPKGGCNFITDIALQFPLTIFLQLVNLPAEHRTFLRQWIETYSLDPDIEAKRKVSNELREYLSGWIKKRTAEPGEDMISRVIKAKINGRPYTDAEILGTVTLLFHAGLDTVANTLGFMAYHLARNPSAREYIRANSDKMHDIVQELLRRCTVANQSRVVAKDTVHKGVFLKKGDRVTLPGSLYNMDSELTPNPDVIDFTRRCPHVTFGAGPHSCAGARLARREISLFLEEWLARIPEFEIDPTKPLRMQATVTNQLEELWLRWPVA